MKAKTAKLRGNHISGRGDSINEVLSVIGDLAFDVVEGKARSFTVLDLNVDVGSGLRKYVVIPNEQISDMTGIEAVAPSKVVLETVSIGFVKGDPLVETRAFRFDKTDGRQFSVVILLEPYEGINSVTSTELTPIE